MARIAPTSIEPARREVAVTFDDLPAPYGGLQEMQNITSRLLRTIRAHGIPAVGFVNEGKLDVRGETQARTALLAQWVDAGLELGNHTYSHVDIERVPVAAYEADVIRGEPVTRKLLASKGMALRYFRHPYLHTGPTLESKRELDGFLAGRGYTVAPVTIDNDEYMFAAVYARAHSRGDDATMRRVVDAYVPYMETIFAFYENLSSELFGSEIPQVLLLHANPLNADHFEDIVRMMQRRGYVFVRLEDALQDPAYRLPDGQFDSGLSWLLRWAAEREPKIVGPEVPAFIAELYAAAQHR
jgi:peptidoglycan/xylan/chitin deacetylase (PgdA/CDA1 family)